LHPRNSWERIVWIGCVTLLVAGLASTAHATVERAEPLEIRAGPPPEPEQWAQATAAERLEQGAQGWRAHGYQELPVLARAALLIAEREGQAELAKHAGEWALASPAVQLEAARVTRSPAALFRGLAALPQSFPAVVWLSTLTGAAFVLACLLGAAATIALALIRGFPLLGHSLGHLVSGRSPRAWPGALALGSGLALLPLLGVGPALMVGVGAAVALPWVRGRQAWFLVALLTLAGAALGPPLERWSSLATAPAPGSGLFAAWRTERAQPLPRDRTLLEERVSHGVAGPLEKLALATALKREGKLEEAEAILEPLVGLSDPTFASRAANMLGIIEVARGEVRKAIRLFSEARDRRQSAPILYNLSQAYGRAIELDNQRRLFEAAKEMNGAVISRAAAYTGANVHHYMLDDPISVRAYLAEAFQPGPEARLLAMQLRRRTLGPSVPAWGWLLLPALAALGRLVKVGEFRTCPRCLRSICPRCSPVAVKGPICLRCQRLSVEDDTVDPRVRRLELARDRWRQLLVGRGLALLGLSVPGSADVLAGRAGIGSVLLTAVLAGLALLIAKSTVPTPTDVGNLSSLFVFTGALLLVGGAYAAGWLGVLSRRPRKEATR
jgi:tetratricopeptide (TPR) repeat protein